MIKVSPLLYPPESAYQDLAGKIKLIKKCIPAGNEKVITIIQKLRLQFSVNPHRPTIMEELNKILK